MEPFPCLHYSRVRLKCDGTRAEMWWHTSRNVMAHAQKPDFFFRRNGRVHLNRQGRQFSRLLAAEVCASAVVMLDTPRSEVVWRVLATHSIRQFPLSLPLPCVTVCHHVSTGLYPFDKWLLKSPEETSGYCTEQTHYSSQELKPGLPPCKELQHK